VGLVLAAFTSLQVKFEGLLAETRRSEWCVGVPLGRQQAHSVRQIYMPSGLSGEVLDGGSDWQTVRDDGAMTLSRPVLATP